MKFTESSNLRKLKTINITSTLIISLIFTGCGGGNSKTENPVILNTLPIAKIADVPVVNDLTTTTIDGSSSSDSDGSITAVVWKQIDNGAPEVKIQSPSSFKTDIDFPDIQSKTFFEFQLTVTDNLGGKNTDTTTIEVNDINCLDYAESIPEFGVYHTDYSQEMEPGCNGDLYISNNELMQIDWVNTISGEILATFPLSSNPKQLEFDPQTGNLYVTFQGIGVTENYYAVINRNEMTIEYVELDEPIIMLTLKDSKSLFVTTKALNAPKFNLHYLKDNEIAGGPWKINVSAIRYNHLNEQIVASSYATSPSSLYRFDFDNDGNMSILEHIRTDGANGNDLEISNDGSIIVLAAGGGNGDGYDIFNYDSKNLSNVRGKWNVGAYPRSVSFSYDDSMLATSNYTSLIVYDTTTYEEVLKKEIPKCDYSIFSDAEFSRNGKMVFLKQDCLIKVNGVNDRVNYVHYFKIPEKSE